MNIKITPRMGFEPMRAIAHRISSPARYLALLSRHFKKKLTNTNLLLYLIVMIYIVYDYALSSISILTLSGTLTFITCLIALSSASIPTRRL